MLNGLCQWLKRRNAVSCLVSLLFICANPAYAIPPPDTLALIGGSIVYPGLLLVGIFSVFLRYFWIKTNLYLVWRIHWAKILIGALVLGFIFSPPITNPFMPDNHPATAQTIQYWENTGQKTVFIDIRSKQEYEKSHWLNAINFPAGNGLTDFLKKSKDEKIILYCEVGLRTSIFSGVNADPKTIIQSLNENRLFYFPGGFYEMARLGVAAPVPIIVNLSPDYTQYLLQKNDFTELHTTVPNWLFQYKNIVAHQSVPIINATASQRDEIIQQLGPLQVKHYYFANSTESHVHLYIRLTLFILVVFMVMFIVRRIELFDGVLHQPSPMAKWKNVIISLVIAVSAMMLNLFNVFIPFDFELHAIGGNSFANNGYLVAIYLLFALALLIHLIYPDQRRMNLLREKLSSQFVANHTQRLFKLPSWKEFLAVIVVICFLWKFHYSISATFVVGLFLLIPIVVDVLLYYFLTQFKNTPEKILKLLVLMGYAGNPKHESVIRVQTLNEEALAKVYITYDKQVTHVGLFSAEDPFKKPLEIVRNLLLFFQQDLELSLDKDNHIVAIKLMQNNETARVRARHILIKHHHILPGSLDDIRFDSATLNDIFTNPTPLMLDVLNARWDKSGGSLKGLNKLGVAVFSDEKTKLQWVGLSNRIYLDRTFEKSIFSENKLNRWLRKKIIQLKFSLAMQTIQQDYYTLMLPRIQLRLLKHKETLQQSQSDASLKKLIQQALTQLCRESAIWQTYSSLVHQYAFNQLHNPDEVMSHPTDLPMTSYYSLIAKNAKKESSAVSHPFIKAEWVRTQMRQLQLQEWQLVSLLLEKLEHQLKLPISLSNLLLEDFQVLPKETSKLIELLHYRNNTWQLQNAWSFPESFSLREVEENSITQRQSELSALRVAGNQKIVIGSAVILNDRLKLEALPRNSILIADNLLPEEIILCKQLNAIILKQGGYLTHAAIIAREKNIPMLAQFEISEIHAHDKLMIHSGNQVAIIKPALAWEFLENLSLDSDIGNKALRLAMLSQQGFQVPTAIVLNHMAVEKIVQSSDDVYQIELTQLFQCLTQNTSAVILRSSTNLEDASDLSYAGLFYSEPNIKTVEQLIRAIRNAQENVSARENVIKEYNAAKEIKLNLILQAYVQSENQLGGVLFTKCSMPELMHVEIAHGGVEGVTTGNAIKASVYIDAQGQTMEAVGEQTILSQHAYRELYSLGRKLEALFEKPQDIEWIYADGAFHLIQSRDITKQA